jgi:arsenate reductase-like glutaredoxin family protein
VIAQPATIDGIKACDTMQKARGWLEGQVWTAA